MGICFCCFINLGFLECFAYNDLVAQAVASLVPMELFQGDPCSNPVDGREEGRFVSVLDQSSKLVILDGNRLVVGGQIIVFCFL